MNINRPLFFFLFYQLSQKFFWGPNLNCTDQDTKKSGKKEEEDQDTTRKIGETKSTLEIKLHCFC